MTWSEFYLLCFVVGFLLSTLSFLAGAVHIHLPFKMHLPFQGGHHAGGVGSGHAHGVGAKGGLAKGGAHVSWFNASTAMAFLAWFGGVGYILTNHSHFVAITSLGFALAAGLFAGWLVFRFMMKLMGAPEARMKSEDYRVEGSVGTLSMPIRENGTGEVIYSLGGSRRCSGARSETGEPIEKGLEVVITKYEKGIAYVQRWEDFTK
jgi:membrane protein implicated in regulation of membrane protease activity